MSKWTDLIRDAHGERLGDKELWYRLPEREETKTPATFKVKDVVFWKRTVARAGYFCSPTDIPEDELEKRGKGFLRKRANFYLKYGENINITEDAPDEGGPVTLEIVNAIIGAASTMGWSPEWRKILKRVNYAVRENWLNEQLPALKAKGIPTNLRTFWYVDHEQAQGHITGKKQCWIGEFYPASGGGDYDDYEPAGLDVKTHQTLYVVTCDNYYNVGLPYSVLVHPLDLKGVG